MIQNGYYDYLLLKINHWEGITMSKRFMLVVMVVILLGSQAIVTSVLSQSAKKESKSVVKPPACVCSNETVLTISDDYFLALGVEKKTLKKAKSAGNPYLDRKVLFGEAGQIFNCICGKTQCVVTQRQNVSCVKGSFFSIK